MLPIIKFSNKNKDQIKIMFKKFNKNDYLNFVSTLNGLVYDTFELSKKEIEYINSKF